MTFVKWLQKLGNRAIREFQDACGLFGHRYEKGWRTIDSIAGPYFRTRVWRCGRCGRTEPRRKGEDEPPD